MREVDEVKMGSLRSIQHRDPNTLSNFDQFTTIHTTANFSIDFENEVLFGNILLDIQPLVNPKENDLVLDASFLDVREVTVDGISSPWNLSPRTEPYGNALRISLKDTSGTTERLKVEVSSLSMSCLLDPCTQTQPY